MNSKNYEKLVADVVEEKAALVPDLNELATAGKLPEAVEKAAKEFDAWATDMKAMTNITVAPEADPAVHFAHELETIKSNLGDDGRHRVDIFSSHAGELQKLAKETLAQ